MTFIKTFLLACASLCAFAFASNASFADEAEVKSAITDYVSAFNLKKVDDLAGMWSKKAVHIDLGLNQITEGRDSIKDDLKASFETQPELQISGSIDHIMLIRQDIATVSGEVALSNGQDPPMRSHFNALLVKNDGKWQIEKMEESPVVLPNNANSALQQLGWMVGQWQDQSQEPPVTTNVEWAQGNNFLIRTTDVSTSENTVERSTQLIGWDARAQTIRSWTFNADGSFGEAEWHKDTDGWTIVSMQTLADGKHATGTYILIPQGKDSFSIQLTGHEVDGEPQPTTDAVMVVRVPEKSTTEPSQPSTTSTSPAP